MTDSAAPVLLGFQERLDAASSAVLYPAAKYRPIVSHGGPMTAQDGLCLHVTTSHFDPYGYFSNPNNGASSTWWIGETTIGQCDCPTPHDVVLIEQYYDALMKCWAQMAGNGLYQALETSGVPSDPLSPAMVHTAAHLYAWGHLRLGWALQDAETPGAKGFIWHGAGGVAWGNHPFCPGTLRRSQRAAILQQAHTIIDGGGGHYTPTKDTAPRYVGILVKGAQGLPVHEWQQRMYNRGWHRVPGTTKPFTVDGVFGNDTLAVVEAFQRNIVKHGWKFVDAQGRRHGTSVSGEVDMCTWHAAWDAPNLS